MSLLENITVLMDLVAVKVAITESPSMSAIPVMRKSVVVVDTTL